MPWVSVVRQLELVGEAGEFDALFLCGRDSLGIAGVGMAHDAGSGVGGQHSLEAEFGLGCAVGHDHHAGVNGVADSHTAAGASWVSVHHGGGVGIGYSIHAGMVIVADGAAETELRLQRVLTTDPGTGIMRHADAGYPEAVTAAKEKGVKIPGLAD